MAWYETAWKALSEAKLDVALTTSAGSFICIGLDHNGIVDFHYLLWLFWAVGVFAGSLVVFRCCRMLTDQFKAWWSARVGRNDAAAKRKAVLDRLALLSDEEERTLAWMVQHNQMTIAAELGSFVPQALEQKGLLIKAGGHGDTFNWPHSAPPFVWEELQRQRDRFMAMQQKGKAHPWRRHVI